MTTKGDVRLIRAYAKLRKQAWRPLFAAFKDAPNKDKAAQRSRMRTAVATMRGEAV